MRHATTSVVAVISLLGLYATALADGLLGTAQTFVVLGGSTVTNTGPSIVNGDAGVWPGLAMTGFPPGVVNGTQHISDAVAQQAHNDAAAAFATLASFAPTQTLTGQDLGGLTLFAGTYFFASSAALTGVLTLDAQGNPDALFVFQIGSTLTTSSGSLVTLLNGADGCNIYWQVGSSATLGTGTTFQGSVIAQASITLTSGVTIPDGRVIALDGAITMDTNTVTTDCIPTPSAAVVLSLASILAARRRR